MPDQLRVLVADDHAGIVKAVSRLLGLTYDVVGSVGDGGGLLEATRRLKPDVIVLDVNLPDIDGLTMCHQVTQIHPDIHIIVFTAVDDPDIRRRAFDAGAYAFVHKLALAEELLGALEQLDRNRVDSAGLSSTL